MCDLVCDKLGGKPLLHYSRLIVPQHSRPTYGILGLVSFVSQLLSSRRQLGLQLLTQREHTARSRGSATSNNTPIDLRNDGTRSCTHPSDFLRGHLKGAEHKRHGHQQ